ncbi:MAG: PHP domain-containing protein [Desulfatitalea sp.]|nr:PHP domain-containing protein [Desulfatitalea sp.]NNK02713.1 PHP domain-containing protein [Desulfatitalea sp.]
MDSNPPGGIDLHIHSTASDGTCTPEEIVAMAANRGLEAIAITDHDTLGGSRRALVHTIPERPHVITGVEISAQPPNGFSVDGSLHVLGYGMDLDHPGLNQALDDLQAARNGRVARIVERLNHIGIALNIDEVLSRVGQGSAGRPHVAQALMAMGVARDVNDAFDRFLAKGKPAYVSKYRIPCQEALALIRSADGVPVLAHPYLVPDDPPGQLTRLVEALSGMGLMGIEAYYSHHLPAAQTFYLETARRFDLLVTGGSDFHGTLIPEIQLGRGLGDLCVPFACYEALADRVPRRNAV